MNKGAGELLLRACGLMLAAAPLAAQIPFTDIDAPATSPGLDNVATCISGNKIVGYYFYLDGLNAKSRGYVYDGVTWTDSPHPAASGELNIFCSGSRSHSPTITSGIVATQTARHSRQLPGL